MTTSNITEVLVCEQDKLRPGARQLIKVNGRNIAVINHKGHLFAIDNACYHHGGPLLSGDIEDLEGHPCIVCPWHSYRIALDTGEGMYWGVQPSPIGPPTQILKSKGSKQRTHRVEIRNGSVYCVVDLSGPKIESDTYATMAIANSEAPSKSAVEGGGHRPGGLHSNIRSGHVFQGTPPMHAPPPASAFSSLPPAFTTPSCTVRCVQVSPLSPTVSRFVFDKASGHFFKRLVPGQYVTLNILESNIGKRSWTVTSVREHGGWFSICVKNSPSGKGGSKFLHDQGTQFTAELLDVEGDFTFSHRVESIQQSYGQVLLLSAGIGVTPMIASLATSFDKSFVKHVVHAHCDRTLDDVVELNLFLALGRAYPNRGGSSTQKAYELELFLTKPNADPQTTSNDSTPLLCPITQRRLNSGDVARFLQKFLLPVPPVVMICGPPGFLDEVGSWLLAAGVPQGNILQESFM